MKVEMMVFTNYYIVIIGTYVCVCNYICIQFKGFKCVRGFTVSSIPSYTSIHSFQEKL